MSEKNDEDEALPSIPGSFCRLEQSALQRFALFQTFAIRCSLALHLPSWLACRCYHGSMGSASAVAGKNQNPGFSNNDFRNYCLLSSLPPTMKTHDDALARAGCEAQRVRSACHGPGRIGGRLSWATARATRRRQVHRERVPASAPRLQGHPGGPLLVCAVFAVNHPPAARAQQLLGRCRCGATASGATRAAESRVSTNMYMLRGDARANRRMAANQQRRRSPVCTRTGAGVVVVARAVQQEDPRRPACSLGGRGGPAPAPSAERGREASLRRSV